MTVDAPTAGRRRIDPGAVVTVQLAALVRDAATDVRLVAEVPPGWSVGAAGNGTIDPYAGTVSWPGGDVSPDTLVEATLQLRAAILSPTGERTFDVLLKSRVEHADGIADTASVRLRVAPEIVVEHVVFAQVDGPSQVPTYLVPDEPLEGLARDELFRIRFQVRNADLVQTVLSPGIQYRRAGETAYADVPANGPVQGVPFYLGTEWRPVAGGSGTLPGPDTETISPSEIRQHDRDDDTQEATDGRRLMRAAGAAALALPGDSYTEVEFAVRSSLDLPFSETFQLRLVDGRRPITVATVAVVRSGPRPQLILSPGQRDGVPVGPPVDERPTAVSDVDFPLVAPNVIAAAWPEQGGVPRYRLAYSVPAAPFAPGAPAAPFTSPHSPDGSLVSDACAVCHGGHTAQGPFLLAQPTPQETLCFACHDGSGSSLNTKAQFTDASVPVDIPATRSYYRHDVVASDAPECADCHNAHNATADPAVQYADGWSVAGAQAAVSGVAVTNGPAGSAPTYSFKDGTYGKQPTREYQICFRCHSGFASLGSNAGWPPSQYVLDKAVELSPNNASYHPVEAAGTNASAAMANSLNGTSPYKQWNFEVNGTVRCVNCHGDPRKYVPQEPPPQPPPPAAGDDLAPHSSQYRGILIQDYQDRQLKGRYELYDDQNFALCYVCHAEAPFQNDSTGATNFDFHAKHLTRISNKGDNTSTDIDIPGAGQGNATCAECHFRTHGTALAVNVGDRSNTRLVNFAPNVTANGSVLTWTSTGTGSGSCTLTCHGKDHSAAETHYP